MGVRKFKLSDMIPNAWFYKLKDMSKIGNLKPKKHHFHFTSSSNNTSTLITPNTSATTSDSSTKTNISHRTSQYFKRALPKTPPPPPISPPKKSTAKKNRASTPRRRIPPPAKPSAPEKTQIRKDPSCSKFSNPNLPPIVTKRDTQMEKETDGSRTSCSVRRMSVSSPGIKLRANSPRILNRKLQGKGNGRRSRKRVALPVPESVAVVKSTVNPKKDFKESMMEMIVENGIKKSKDLEDLLACYLELNSNEYHAVIIDVFKQIWFDLADMKMKKK